MVDSNLVKSFIHAAIKASNAILEIYAASFEIELKNDGSPVTIADKTSSEILKKELANLNIPIIDEESKIADFEIRKEWEFSLCIDPLDGTKEFIKKNDEFCVNIALFEKNEAVFGLIASPVKREILIGGPGFGVFKVNMNNPEELNAIDIKQTDKIYFLSSRTHFSGTTLEFLNLLKHQSCEIEYIKLGSALKFFEFVHYDKVIYPRFAPTMEWDIAAGHAILKALGGNVIHANTKLPLVYNRENLINPYFVAYSKNVSHLMK